NPPHLPTSEKQFFSSSLNLPLSPLPFQPLSFSSLNHSFSYNTASPLKSPILDSSGVVPLNTEFTISSNSREAAKRNDIGSPQGYPFGHSSHEFSWPPKILVLCTSLLKLQVYGCGKLSKLPVGVQALKDL
ncbi:hypothetical protein V2J09_017817, partial [Rumex salicifolius]